MNPTGSRVEQADKAQAEHFKHADALKPAQTDSARIDQLMDDAAKPETGGQNPGRSRSPYGGRECPFNGGFGVGI